MKGMFNLRTSSGTGEIIGADVLCYCQQEDAKVLMKELGGIFSKTKCVWVLRAQEQERGLSRVLPFIRNASVRRRMGRVLMYRRTQVQGKVSEQVKEFRKELREDVDYR